MNFLTAANTFLRQVVRMQGLLLRPTRDVPNAVTAAAMRAANRIATDPKAPGFATVDELFADQDARPCARYARCPDSRGLQSDHKAWTPKRGALRRYRGACKKGERPMRD